MPTPQEEAERVHQQALVLARVDGNFNEALSVAESTLVLFEASFGPEDQALIPPLRTLLAIRLQLGSFDAAAELGRRVLALAEAARSDAEVETALENLSAVHAAAGRPDLAEPLLRRAVNLAKKSYGPKDVRYARLTVAYGSLVADFGRNDREWQEAQVMLVDALRLLDQSTSAEDGLLRSKAHNAIGAACVKRRHLDEAATHLARAIELFEAVQGTDHPDLDVLLNNLAGVEEAQGHPLAAAELKRRARSIRTGHLGVLR